MIKEQATMPASLVTAIELTDEELEGLRGGCHDDWDSGRGSDNSSRGFREDSSRGFREDDSFGFRESFRSFSGDW